jgi:predicted nucleic acid-binding protein
LLQSIASRDIQCIDPGEEAIRWIAAYAEQYESLRPQLADLSLIYLAERHRIQYIFTLDRRDFLVYRSPSGQPYRLLPESL